LILPADVGSIGPSRDPVRSMRSRRDFVAISTRSLRDLARSGAIWATPLV